jgi:TRAP-type C4-dicarboxylate transport system permease small subunit
MMERIFDRTMRAVELMLGYAFIFAVGLNFANVLDRYVLNKSLLGADEIEVFVMVGMTFLGAAVVTWRKKHLRMDVIAKTFPTRIQAALRGLEAAVLIALAAAVLVESSDYTLKMFRLGVTSNTAGVPMWIPHGTVAVGAGLMALAALWQGLAAWRGRNTGSMGWSGDGKVQQ